MLHNDASKSLHDLRLNAIKLVHIAKRDLALEIESYRAILHRVTGKTTAADLSLEELDKVVAEFKRLGWQPQRKGAASAGSRPMAHDALSRKIRALWLSLWQLGELTDPSEEALAAFVKRTAGTEALQWLDPNTADQVIKALRGWCERVGFKQPDASAMRYLNRARKAAGLAEEGYGFVAKAALIEAQWRRLAALGAFPVAGDFAHLGAWFMRNVEPVSAPHFLTPRGSTRAVEELGEWIRRLKAKGAEGSA